jgi:hypothetical protein
MLNQRFSKRLLKICSHSLVIFALALTEPSFGNTNAFFDPPSEDRNSALKISILEPFSGILSISWEKSFTKKTSLELSIGTTLSEKNRLPWSYNEHQGVFNNFGYLHWSMKTRAESGIGVMAEVGYKFYATDKKSALSGFYLAPKARFTRFNFTLIGVDADGMDVLEPKRTWDNRYSLNLEAGYQIWVRRFCLDAHIGLQSSLIQQNQLSAMQHWYDSQWNFYWHENQTTLLGATGYLGLKVGYRLN